MEKILTNNTSKKLLTHNISKLPILPNKDQSVSESTSDKSLSNIQQDNSPNKQTTTPNNPDFKRLKILTKIYNPTKYKTNLVGYKQK